MMGEREVWRPSKRWRIAEAAAMLLLLDLKLWLMRDVGLQLIGNAGADDKLMVRGAENLLAGKWLGAYDQFTLMKGAFFPLFLSAGHVLHIDYISLVQMVYAMACLVFAAAFLPLFARGGRRTRILFVCFYALLLFHPVMADHDVVQRVYRNCLTPAQVLLIFGGTIGFYLREGKGSGKWIAAASLSLASMWLTREDSAWILPYVLAAAVLTAVKKRKVILPFLPILATAAAVLFVCLINLFCYHVAVDTEIAGGSFPRLMKDIYRVDAGEEVSPYVSVSREKLALLYRECPSMAEISKELEPLMDAWAGGSGRLQEDKENLEVENGWFFWVLRDAAAQHGVHGSARNAEAFYRRAAGEIEQAFAEGRLKKQAGMPTALMAPWRRGMLPDLLRVIARCADWVENCHGAVLYAIPQAGDAEEVAAFTALTRRTGYTGEEAQAEQPGLQRINRFSEHWRRTAGVIAWCGRFSLALLLVLFARRRLDQEERVLLLFLFGMLAALLCLYAGVAYNELRSCLSVTVLYLCAAYAPASAIHVLAVYALGGRLVRRFRGIEIG